MDIKYNKDKSVTINATNDEYYAICMAVMAAHNQTDLNFYKPIVDAINKAYNEQNKVS